MGLMLYLATATEQPTLESSDLRIEPIDPQSESVRQVFTLPFVRFVGAHTGCSCGFPYVIAEQPVQYYEGMFADDEDAEADRTSLTALLPIVFEHVNATGSAELYPVWYLEEKEPPKGLITLSADELTPDRFFFIERFLYRIVPPLADGSVTAG